MGIYHRIATGMTTVRDTVIFSSFLFISVLAGIWIGLMVARALYV